MTLSLKGLSPNGQGCVYMVIGSLGYVINDAFVRAATDEGLDVYQALFFRGIAMTVLFAAASQVRGDRLTRVHLQPPLVARVAAELVATALFFAALVRMDFANAQTILLLVPFAVTLAAAATLGERVSRLQYGAVLAGFGGVLAVVRPATDGFSIWSLAVVAAAAVMVVRELATQRIDDDISPLPVALLTAVSLTAFMGLLSILSGWGPVTLRAVVFLGLACLCLMVGYIFTIQTVRVGELSVSAPFRYTTLVAAVVIGVLVFDEPVDLLTGVGCGVIVAAGLWSIRLDQ